jgi:hypothetical protein
MLVGMVKSCFFYYFIVQLRADDNYRREQRIENGERMGFFKFFSSNSHNSSVKNTKTADNADIKLVEDIPGLEQMLAEVSDPRKEQYLKKQLRRKYLEQILEADSQQDISTYLDKLDDDEDSLAAAACRCSDSGVATAAALRLKNPGLILKVFRNCNDKQICSSLLDKELDMELLKKISHSAANTAIRKQAAKNLNKLKQSVKTDSSIHANATLDNIPLEEETRNSFAACRGQIENFEKLCVELETLAAKSVSDSTAPDMEALQQQWRELEPVPPRFMEILEKRFHAGLDKVRENIAQVEKLEQLRLERLARIENLCLEAEKIAALPDDKRRKLEKLGKLRLKWDEDATRLHPTDIAAATERFNAIEQNMEAELKAEQATQQQLTDELNGYLDELKNALSGDDLRSFAVRIKELRTLINEEDRFNVPCCREQVGEFKRLSREYFSKLKNIYEAREYERCASSVIKNDLCAKAEALLAEQDMRLVSSQLKVLHSAWRKSGRAHRDEDQILYERFKNICDELHRRCGEFFDQLRMQYEENLNKKRQFADEAEALSISEDWHTTGERLKTLQQEWKEIGPGTKELEKEVFERFRNACNAFFDRRKNNFREMEKVWEQNAETKRALIAQVGKLDALSHHDALELIRQLRADWKNSGHARNDIEQSLWHEFDSGINAFFEKLDAEKPENMRKKLELCEEAEAFGIRFEQDADPDFRQWSHDADALFAKWKTIGSAPQDKEQELWKRFDAPLNRFYEARKEFHHQLEDKKQQSMQMKLKLIAELEHILEHPDGRNFSDDTEQVKALQHQWKEAGATFHDKEQELWEHFHGVCDDFFNQRRTFFEQRHQEREANLKKKLELCVRMEKLAGIDAPENNKITAANLADELSFALKNGGVDSSGQSHRNEEARIICQEWHDVGFAGREESPLYHRFKRAKDAFFGNE